MIIICHHKRGPLAEPVRAKLSAYIERVQPGLFDLIGDVPPGSWLAPVIAMRVTYALNNDGDAGTGWGNKTLFYTMWGGQVTDDEQTQYRVALDGSRRIVEVLL